MSSADGHPDALSERERHQHKLCAGPPWCWLCVEERNEKTRAEHEAALESYATECDERIRSLKEQLASAEERASKAEELSAALSIERTAREAAEARVSEIQASQVLLNDSFARDLAAKNPPGAAAYYRLKAELARAEARLDAQTVTLERMRGALELSKDKDDAACSQSCNYRRECICGYVERQAIYAAALQREGRDETLEEGVRGDGPRVRSAGEPEGLETAEAMRFFPRTRMSRRRLPPPRATPLSVEVDGERVVITIGIATLAKAFECSDYAHNVEEGGDFKQGLRVLDELVFANDVVEMLNATEDGVTMMERLLDLACVRTVADGTMGVGEIENG